MDFGLPLSEIALLLAGGAFAGILSGLFGVGGGGVLVPVLYDLFGALGAAPAAQRIGPLCQGLLDQSAAVHGRPARPRRPPCPKG